jgi:hypothetical protein
MEDKLREVSRLDHIGVSGGANTVYFWRLQNHLS